MKFDFAIGNPPYQDDNENSVRKSPVYNYFMDEAYKVAHTVELITPGRFLFDAGQTPKDWNQKMLMDDHFKVIYYEKDASKIFSNTEIKGGVAISIRSSLKNYGRICVYTPYEELNTIYSKVKSISTQNGIDVLKSAVSQRGLYRLTDAFFSDFPFAASRLGSGTGNMIVSNILEKIPEAFVEKCSDKKEYMKIFGRVSNKRVYRYIKRKYVINNNYIDKYKLFFPEANGNGIFGETLTLPEIGYPGEGSTDTFINVGRLSSKKETETLLKYIKTKFLRALLGIKKATQHTPPTVWDTIPMLNFTSNSDIDWSKSVKDIDRQLYAKYGLSDEEIAFIESNVKEMA